MAALKLTFPTQLPKNEKDLICMLLAGRLKDLFKGKLICAQLALDDLLKDVAGVSALGSLQTALNDMKGALNGFKTVSGYDNILHGINQALGQVNNVFSLGGLCPSPVRAPKIPDLLAQLNANMFGQANNILSALGKLSNPSMCLGGGPGGFGINWNSMPGDLKNLKAAIKQAKNSNLGMTPALNAFASNLKSQTSRMKGEIKRLEKNLADPLGLNEKLNTAKNIQRVKNISDGYPVKDAKGILHPNVLKSMVPADIESTIDNGDRTPVKYVTKPILDYCGDVVGYEKVAVTGDPKYIGWDPNGDPSLNTDNPTVNPVAGYSSYTYTFKQEGAVVKVYDTNGVVVTDLKLSRGIAYRLGFELINKQIKFYSNSAYTTIWTDGLTYSRSPEYGNDMEIILPDNNTTFVRGELDWSVLIENPTTPNVIYWKTTDGAYSGSFSIDGVTTIPLADRTYDVSMAVKKACLQLVNVPATTEVPVNYETTTTSRTYTASNKIYNSSGQVISDTQTSLSYNQQYFILDDIETVDYNDNADPNNKIIKTITKYNDSLYLIAKRYVSIENGIEFNQIYFYRATGTDEATADYCILLKFDNPISILNSSKLPYTDNYSYKITRLFKNTAGEFVPSMTPVSGSDETKFELLPNEKIIRWNLTSFTDKAQVPNNEFILQTDIEIDPADTKRTFINSNPIESRMYFYFKFNDGSALESTITYSNNSNITTTPAPSNTTTAAPSNTTTAAPSNTTTTAAPTTTQSPLDPPRTRNCDITSPSPIIATEADPRLAYIQQVSPGVYALTGIEYGVGTFETNWPYISSAEIAEYYDTTKWVLEAVDGSETITYNNRGSSGTDIDGEHTIYTFNLSPIKLNQTYRVTAQFIGKNGSLSTGSTSAPVWIRTPPTAEVGFYNGVRLIASGTNPTYWVYPIPTNKVYPTSVTRTSSETLIGIGETPVISITYTFNDGLVALEPMELHVVDQSRHFNVWDTVNVEPGDSSVTWTRPLEKMDFPRIIRAGMTGIVSKYYDFRLGSPRGISNSSISETESSVEFRVSSTSKPIIYNQQIACNLLAGKTFEEIKGNTRIPAVDTEGTATYDTFYYANGDPYFIYRGGCYFKTYYTKKISGPNAGWCTPAYFTQQGMPPPSSSLDPGELVYDSRNDCLAAGGTLPPGVPVDPTTAPTTTTTTAAPVTTTTTTTTTAAPTTQAPTFGSAQCADYAGQYNIPADQTAGTASYRIDYDINGNGTITYTGGCSAPLPTTE